MTLTPEDVSSKRFTPVRLREGYDMGEVDQFLDEVEAELERLIAESDDLRAKLAAAQGGAPVTSTETPAASGTDEGRAADVEDAPQTSVAAAAPREEIRVVTAAEASSAATRLLELATNNADAVVAEAKDEAEKIVSDARSTAQRLEAETKSKVDKLDEEARTRAQNLDAETEAMRNERLSDLNKEKARLDSEVENLRAFEREYRSRLKSYFTQQLQALDGVGEGGELPDAEDGVGPKRLKSVPGDEQADQQGEDSGDRSNG